MTKAPSGYRFEHFSGPATFQSAALARKGDLELRLQQARARVGKNPSLASLVALYVDMIGVIDRHMRNRQTQETTDEQH